MRIKLALSLLLLATVAFTSCTDKEESNDSAIMLENWAGSWAILGNPQIISTKASSGDITISPVTSNTILINGSLFNRGNVKIEGIVSGKTVTFDYQDSRGKLSGTGTMRDNKNYIDFIYTTEDEADLFQYKARAQRQ